MTTIELAKNMDEIADDLALKYADTATLVRLAAARLREQEDTIHSLIFETEEQEKWL